MTAVFSPPSPYSAYPPTLTFLYDGLRGLQKKARTNISRSAKQHRSIQGYSEFSSTQLGLWNESGREF